MTTFNSLQRALGLSAMLLAACGGSDAPRVTMIGAAGGTVSGPNGAQVVVPAGALATDTAIAVAASSTGSPQLPAGFNKFGVIYAFTPHGTTFAVPVTITVPFDAAALPPGATPMLYKTNAAGTWDVVPGATVSGSMITAQVTSFSWLAPQVTGQPADVTVQQPDTASFSVTASGFDPPFSYQWQRSGNGGAPFTSIQGATASSYITGPTSVAGDNGARYRVLVSNASGELATSDPATLTVTGAVIAPAITMQPADQSVAAAGSASFSVVATGTSLIYQWQKNGAPIAAQTNASLNLSNVQAIDAGNYAVVVSNFVNGAAINSVTSNVVTLTVATTPPATGAARIAAGGDYSYARRANGDLYSWGSDSAGTLGAGNGDQSRNAAGLVLTNNIASVAAGGAHGIAVRGTGEVRGWGYNGFGQLGDGSNQTREAPVSATVDVAGTMQFSDAVEACGGTLHSLVRRSNGTVHAMGANNFGQIGDGTPADPSSPGRLRSVPVVGITTATAIACRGNHSLALLADGTVRAWGLNSAGQLGDGTMTNRDAPVVVAGLSNVIAIAAGQDHSLALRNDGSVWAWGGNSNGKLGDGTDVNRPSPTATLLTSQITAIAAGIQNSLAIRNDGIVLSWGINETGQLGSGSLTPGFRPQPAPVANLTSVVAISASTGRGHALAVRSDGTVWAWGDNMGGQLGNGSSAPFSATPVQVSGLNLN